MDAVYPRNLERFARCFTRSELSPLRGLWLGMETDLLHMGISSLADLRDRDVDALVRDYCRQTGRPLDPALRPCFASLVAFAKTGATTAWWFLARAEAFRDREQVLARTG